MADIARVSVSLGSRSANWADRLEGNLFCAEALTAGDLVMDNGSGKIIKSDGTKVLGIVVEDYAVNEAVEVWGMGTVVSYGNNMTKFAPVYASEATDGALADATGASTLPAIGFVRQDGKSIMLTALILE